jgi:hypothetical protein
LTSGSPERGDSREQRERREQDQKDEETEISNIQHSVSNVEVNEGRAFFTWKLDIVC